MAAFHKFSHASGLEVSVDESCIYFSGITNEEKSYLAELISMHRPTSFQVPWGPPILEN